MVNERLSNRQVGILKELGIDVWQRRNAVPQSIRSIVEPSAPVAEPLGEPVAAPASPVAIAPPPDVSTRDWDALHDTIRSCVGCALHASRTHAVCGVGDQQSDWLIIGEAPGADEDKQGEPFVGRAGQLLNEMLRAIGLQRQQVFIANVLKCRPPNNRDPQVAEIEQCLPYLQRQIALLKPKVILVVGRIAAQTLLQTEAPVGKLRGTLHEYQGVPLVVTYHPAYLLRSPSQKSKSWADLLLALDVMGRT